MTSSPAPRREDIDALRVAATFLLFVFHGAMIFNPAPFYHVRNGEVSFLALILCGFISLWHMPLFFLLAGWATHQSLAVRGRAGYLRERFSKLFIPLVAGVVLFGPIIKFLELRSGLDLSHTGLRVTPELQDSFRSIIPEGLGVAAPFDEGFLEFLPTFFTDLDRFTWAHLWFVAYLFTFSLAYASILPWLAERALRLGALSRPLVYAPILPLALIQLILRPHWPGIQNLYDDWANVSYYTVYFLSGFILAAQPSFERAVRDEGRRAFFIGVGATGVLLAGVLQVFSASWVMLAGSAVAGWCFCIAILGLGERLAASFGRTLRYLRESAFPVYILHQAAIVVPGYFIVELPLGITAKFALILVVSVVLTLAVYQLLIRSNRPLAFFFGAKPRPRTARQASPTLAQTARP